MFRLSFRIMVASCLCLLAPLRVFAQDAGGITTVEEDSPSTVEGPASPQTSAEGEVPDASLDGTDATPPVEPTLDGVAEAEAEPVEPPEKDGSVGSAVAAPAASCAATLPAPDPVRFVTLRRVPLTLHMRREKDFGAVCQAPCGFPAPREPVDLALSGPGRCRLDPGGR